MSTETKALVRKLTTLRDLLRKNCGTGAGGFQPGNHCGRPGGGDDGLSESSIRRRKRGKNRKRRGPDRGLGARTRAAQRRRSGRQNASRRKWREELMNPSGSTEGRTLYRRQAGERKDLAETLKADRNEQRKDAAKAIRSTARELKSERKKLAKDQKQDRVKLKRTQEREVEKTHASFDKQRAKLDAKYEAQKPTAKDPEALDRAYAKRKRELDAEQAERISDLNAEHRQARDEMRVFQKIDREQARDEHMDRAEDARKEQRAAVTDINMSAREQIGDLQFSHRGERAELRRDEQDAIRSDREDRQADDKSYSWVDAKATPDDGVPGAQAILDGVLAEMGHAEAWEANSLSAAEHVELLHAVRMEGRRWFRDEATKVLDEVDSLGSKALFGDAASKVKGFFGKARKYVRELFVAGVLAFAGPTPMDAAELRALDEQVAVQHAYLKTFESESVRANKPPDAAFVARAEKYGAAVWGGAQEILRAGAKAERHYTSERRIHQGHDKPCEVCLEQMELEWQPIGTLRPIGDSPCMMNCHCIFIYGWGDSTPRPAALDSDAKSFAVAACRDARGRLVFRR